MAWSESVRMPNWSRSSFEQEHHFTTAEPPFSKPFPQLTPFILRDSVCSRYNNGIDDHTSHLLSKFLSLPGCDEHLCISINASTNPCISEPLCTPHHIRTNISVIRQIKELNPASEHWIVFSFNMYFNWSARHRADEVSQVSFGAEKQHSRQQGVLPCLLQYTTVKDHTCLMLKLLIHSLQVCYQIISIVLQFIKNVLHIWSNQPEENCPICLSIAIPGYQLGNRSAFHLSSSHEGCFNHCWCRRDSPKHYKPSRHSP